MFIARRAAAMRCGGPLARGPTRRWGCLTWAAPVGLRRWPGSLLKNAVLAFFNLARFGAKLLTARKMAT